MSSDAAAAAAASWKESVTQQYRSSEIREIAKVLAALEPNSTGANSKMMLAMRFEDQIFQSSKSLADYRKRLSKRLTKLQKSYKPQQTPSPSTTTNTPQNDEDAATIEASLREKYGPALLFICNNAAAAVDAMRDKHGNERAIHLKQHTDNAEQWAVDIGLIGEGTSAAFKTRRRKVPVSASQSKTKYLDRLKIHLAQRVDNIRRHVVNLTDPDQFLEETLIKLEDDILSKTAQVLSDATLRVLSSSNQQHLLCSSVAGMKQIMERAGAVVPPPRQGHDADIKDASVAYLDKIRASCHALINYMALDADGKREMTLCLKKAHVIAVEGLTHLRDHYKDDKDDELGQKKKIRLEDAWKTFMQYIPETLAEEEEEDMTEGEAVQRPQKRLKRTSTQGHPLVIRTKVLMAPGRKAPSSFVSALQSKRATLIRPSETGAGARIVLRFGTVFEMTVFVSPLFVTIRALAVEEAKGADDATNAGATTTNNDNDDDNTNHKRTTIVGDGRLPTWTPSHANLSRNHHTLISVDGIEGTVSQLATPIAKKLDFASAQATLVLRHCFGEISAYRRKGDVSDFEIEISEATALLKFLGLARAAYDRGGGG